MAVLVSMDAGEDLVPEPAQQVQEAAEAVWTERGSSGGRRRDGVDREQRPARVFCRRRRRHPHQVVAAVLRRRHGRRLDGGGGGGNVDDDG